jgi:hypothetical protein
MDAAPSDESETTITITPNGGTRVEILTTSKLVSNLSATRTEYHDTPPPKSKKESKQRGLTFSTSTEGCRWEWDPAKTISDWSFVHCHFSYSWGNNSV